MTIVFSVAERSSTLRYISTEENPQCPPHHLMTDCDHHSCCTSWSIPKPHGCCLYALDCPSILVSRCPGCGARFSSLVSCFPHHLRWARVRPSRRSSSTRMTSRSSMRMLRQRLPEWPHWLQTHHWCSNGDLAGHSKTIHIHSKTRVSSKTEADIETLKLAHKCDACSRTFPTQRTLKTVPKRLAAEALLSQDWCTSATLRSRRSTRSNIWGRECTVTALTTLTFVIAWPSHILHSARSPALWTDRRLSRALKLRTYQLAMCSTLTHASEAWTLTEAVMRSVNLKLNFIEYPAIHTNYSWSNCTIWN